ncbi:FAD/NAD(P)-binding domain-containing protein [Aspergillus leporis]|uniref:FAD/NAD(P)-binding domain-containing protein n=1 Tax=Aspergillus leporis TaxID=41062 RepID=A0A5N5WNG3_9EURO|nr:FAD/NAD(P)-binding domain-containing protein [Aspergillus leporis]
MSPAVVQKREFYPVAIVGGGIAGITLALSFEKLGIRYILYEGHASLAPDQGASIGLLPNGLRILDQLGLVKEIEKHTAALQRWFHLGAEGEPLSTVHALGYYESKLGYGGLFLERQKLLRIMSKHIVNTDAIRTSAQVVSLQETSDYVTLTASDGSEVDVGLVIGADGVRSCVRDAIERALFAKDKVQSDTYMRTRFACVYGVSPPVSGIAEGDCFSVYRERATILGFTGKNGTIFWFVFEDLGHALPLSQSPRYTAADVEGVCRAVADVQVLPGIPFKNILANRKVAVKVALEEGLAPTWHSDRMVIVGDAAHKMVPNAAMGANQAIESSAVLVNEIGRILQDSSDTASPRETLQTALRHYTVTRQPRTREISERAGIVCRAQLCHGGPAATVLQELPSLSDSDWLFRGFMGFSDAPVLEAIDLTARGQFYDRAIQGFWKRLKARQNEDNAALFDIAI